MSAVGDLSPLLSLSSDEIADLDALNRTESPFDGRDLIDNLIGNVEVAADRIACCFAGCPVSRATLWSDAQRLAGVLQRAGARRGGVVAVALSPGIERLTAVLAVLRTGAAFLPLDLNHPYERLRFQISDSRAGLVIAGAESVVDFASAAQVVRVPLEADSEAHFISDPERRSSDWAYVIYTSGSTGRPKAAANSHSALINRLQWMARQLGVTVEDRILHKTAFGFDVSVWEQLLPLLTGACAVIAPEAARGDARGLQALIEAEAVTLAHFVPTLLEAFLAAVPDGSCSTLRAVVCSGEVLPKSVAAQFAARFSCPLYNYYGPTEAAIDVTAWRFDAADPYDFVPIGRPIQNVRIFVLDSSLERIPIGAVGELHIGGVAVCDGYVGRPALTADRFIPDPFSGQPGQRLYRTGDMVRIHDDGFIEFLGRRDSQVKLRGHRIELGEIEEALRAHPLVRQAAAAVRETAAGTAQLVSFVIPADGRLDISNLRVWLRQRLPYFMIPAVIAALPDLPKTASGKLDRKLLPNPLVERCPSVHGARPRGEIELGLAEIWSNLLKREIDDADANFFSLGGDSVLAIRVVTQARARGLDLEVRDVFERPTVRSLAAATRQALGSGAATSPAEQVWLDATEAARAAASPVGIYTVTPAAVGGLEAALNRIVARLLNGRSTSLVGETGSYWLRRAPTATPETLIPALTKEIGRNRNLVFAAFRMSELDGREILVIAFDPARLDIASLAALPVLLDSASAYEVSPWRFDRSVWFSDSALPATLRPRTVPLPQTDVAIASAETILVGTYASTEGAREASQRIDHVTAAILRAAFAASGLSFLHLIAPESREFAARSGYSVETLVGRWGLAAQTGVEMTETTDLSDLTNLVASLRAGELTNVAEAGPTLRVVEVPRPEHGADVAARPETAIALVVTAAVQGEIAVAIDGGKLHWRWDRALGDWPQAAARLAGRYFGNLAITPSQSCSLRPRPFPLTSLEGADRGCLDFLAKEAIDAYPLTPMQEGLLMRSLYWPESDAYLNQNVIELVGPLDLDSLEKAWDAVTERYEILRTGFLCEGLKRPLQYVARRPVPRLERLDWQHTVPAQIEALIASYLASDRTNAFAMDQAGLFRLAVARLDIERSVVIWTHHHILLDGWCLSLIWGDVFTFYAHFAKGDPAPAPGPRRYRDYVSWLQRKSTSEVDRAFWRDTLAGFDRPTLFSSKSPHVEGEFATWRLPLPESRLRALKSAGARLGLTANAFVQTAWSLLLSERAGTNDVIHGVSVSGRPPELSGVENMVGLFINTIPLRARLDLDATLSDLVRRTQATLAAANTYAHVPLAEILAQWSGRVSPHDRLFDTLIAFENYPEDNLPTTRVAGLEVHDRFCNEKTEYPLGLIVLPGPPMEFHFNFDQSHFALDEVTRLTERYFWLLDRLVDNPEKRVADIESVSPDVARKVLAWAEGGPNHLDGDPLAHLRAGAAAYPDRPALIAGEQIWSYGALCSAIEQLGGAIAAERTGSVVAIMAERSAAFVLGVLAAWASDLVPLILNPAYPDAVLRRTLDLRNKPLLLVSPAQVARAASWQSPIIVACVDGAATGRSWHSPSSHRVAALLQTSGTTGDPKTISLTRAGLYNRVIATQNLYRVGRPRLLANAAPGFDIGLWEILFPLMQGGTLIVASDADLQDPDRLCTLVERWDVNVIHAVPPLADQLVKTAKADRLARLELLVVGGESVSPDLVRELRTSLPRTSIWQGYGPTETSISVADHCCGDADGVEQRVPLGRPAAGCRVYVLDAGLRLCAPGVIGELCVGGVALAQGYLNDPRETALSFVPDPFGAPGARLYRTGDRGRWRDDGLLEFLGRGDQQVKIRGHRVELGAVEARLLLHPLVRQAAVGVHNATLEHSELLAFVVLKLSSLSVESPDGEMFKRWVAEVMPPWAVPVAVESVTAFPLTANGKSDVAALLMRRSKRLSAEALATFESPLEHIVAEAWREVLGAPPPDRFANFFQHGGHSLAAMRFALSLKRRLGKSVRVPVPLLFKYPTPAGLAEALLAPMQGSGAQYTSTLAEGSGVPLVLVHPVEGLSLAYRVLSSHIDGRTIIAIDSPRFGRPNGFATLREMASLYVEWTRSIVGDNPVLLGGWSFGGVVALEMAQLMAANGAAPHGAILIDSYNLAGRTDFAKLLVQPAYLDPGMADRETVQALAREVQRNTLLSLSAPAPRFGGPVLLVKAADDPEVARDLGPRNGWRSDLLPSLEEVSCAVDHHELLRPEHAAGTAAALATFLDRVG